MNFIKLFLKFDIISLNLAIIVWGLLSVNSYREMITNSLQVPQDPNINNFFFATLLSCYLSSNSVFTFVYEFGKSNMNFLFHMINFLFITVLMIFNFNYFKVCDDSCKQDIGNSFYNFIVYFEYLPIFQLIVCIHYFCLFIYILNTNRQAILLNEDFNDVFIQSPLPTGVLRMNDDINLDSNSDSSEGLAL